MIKENLLAYAHCAKKDLKWLAFLSFVLGILGFTSYVSAQTKTAGPISVSYDGDGAIFSASNMAPGGVATNDITVRNNGSESHNFAVATTNVTGELADRVLLSSTIDGQLIWAKSIAQLSAFPDDGVVILDEIGASQERVVTLSLSLNEEAGNELQGKTVKFDLVFGAQGESLERATLSTLSLGALSPLDDGGVQEEEPVPADEGKELKLPQQEGDEGGDIGENVWLLLIVPIAAVGALATMPSSLIRNIGVPLFFGSTAVVLTNFIKGDMDPHTFWSLLGGEVLFAGGIKIIIADKHKQWYRRRKENKSQQLSKKSKKR